MPDPMSAMMRNSRGGGGGESHMEQTGILVGKVEFNP